jgi:phage-related protein
MDRLPRPRKPLLWVASSRKDYAAFPPKVQEAFGFELFLAQTGQHPPSAKVMKGLGTGVLELAGQFDGNAYRSAYTIRFDTAVYVLHCFEKKSRRGIKTPLHEIDLIKRRIREAETDHANRKLERDR